MQTVKEQRSAKDSIAMSQHAHNRNDHRHILQPTTPCLPSLDRRRRQLVHRSTMSLPKGPQLEFVEATEVSPKEKLSLTSWGSVGDKLGCVMYSFVHIPMMAVLHEIADSNRSWWTIWFGDEGMDNMSILILTEECSPASGTFNIVPSTPHAAPSSVLFRWRKCKC